MMSVYLVSAWIDLLTVSTLPLNKMCQEVSGVNAAAFGPLTSFVFFGLGAMLLAIVVADEFFAAQVIATSAFA